MIFIAALFLAVQHRFASATPLSSDGASYAAYDSETKIVSVVETSSGHVTSQLKGLSFGPYYTRFSPDGKLVAGSNMLGEVGLWEVSTGRLILKLVDADQGHLSGVVYPLAFSSSGKRLAVGNMMRERRSRSGPTDGILSIWDTTTGQMVKEIRTDPYETVTSLVFRDHDSTVRLAGLTVKDFDARNGKKRALTLPWMNLDKMSDDGNWAVGGGIGWLDFWDLKERQRKLHIPIKPTGDIFVSTTEVVSPGGKWILVTRSHLIRRQGGDTGYYGVQLDLIESQTGSIRWTVPESVGATFKCFSPDGACIHLSNGEVRASDTGKILHQYADMDIVLLGEHQSMKIGHPIQKH